MASLEKPRTSKKPLAKKHIEKTEGPKLNGEQRPLGVRARQFARGFGMISRKEWRGKARTSVTEKERAGKLCYIYIYRHCGTVL